MMKKGLLMLVLVAVVTGGVFALPDHANTITVDFGPTIIAGAVKTVMDRSMGAEEGVSASAFGIGAQYELQLQEQLSVAFRFAYMGFGMGMKVEDDNYKEGTLKMDISSFSLEGHVRGYFGDTFFLDGMLGFANLTVKYSGEAPVEQSNGRTEIETYSKSFPRGYFKLGAKIGWRIDFGNPGGFVFEPSFGYSLGFGMGDTLPKQLSKDLGGADVHGVSDDAFAPLEDLVFIGGPRFCLSFGWKF